MTCKSDHKTQFDGGPKANENCTPASLAMLAYQSTCGKVDKTSSEVRSLVKTNEETNPQTPGWSLRDAGLAASRMGVQLHVVERGTWQSLIDRRREGRHVMLQGDSDRFPNGTCSGNFDGDHCISIPSGDPANGVWNIDDPICNGTTTQTVQVIRSYAEKFGNGTVYYAYGEEPQTVGLKVNVTESFSGTATMLAHGASAVQLADREYVGIPFGTIKDVYALGVLGENLSSAWPMGTKVALVGDEAAILIRSQVELAEDADNGYVPVGELYVKK